MFLQEGIRECLRNKFKKERRPLISVEVIAETKAKFGAIGRGGRKRSIPMTSDIILDTSVKLVNFLHVMEHI
jgi:hypothetical protein